jgi:hypothetical protein
MTGAGVRDRPGQTVRALLADPPVRGINVRDRGAGCQGASAASSSFVKGRP